MANSLQEQLLRAGLVDEKKAKQVNKAKHKKKKQKRAKGAAPAEEASKQRAREAAAQKAEQDRALNRDWIDRAEWRAKMAEVRQMIKDHAVSTEGGETAYNFIHGKKVKRIYVTDDLLKKLSSGQLMVATIDGNHAVVPQAVGEKIAKRLPECVVRNEEPEKPSEEGKDDYYDQFEVPDDLMW